ncbi:uncharacterized protein [Coffea arabica]|uniref:Reverse transcriptase zinc-binding domain-containing protein n=1 Tax=Coffea arabica TaxID=13443 RepID=A0A6P6T024_COFAR|nr:uncharacterized protein LOC113696452 [Coffea arabica]
MIWEGRWVSNLTGGKIQSAKPTNCEIIKVKQLIKGQQWDPGIINRLFSEEESVATQSIPLSLYDGRDRIRWNLTRSGIYSVKTGYSLLKEMTKNHRPSKFDQNGQSTEPSKEMIWKRLWGLNLKHRIKHFIWKYLNQTLPTNETIATRIGKGCNVCRRCGEEVETIEHLFFFCRNVQDSWKLFPIQWDGCLEHQWNFGRWWGKLQEAAHRNQGSDHIALTANFLWHLWKSRNEVCFNSKVQESHLIVTRAQQEWLEYEEIGKEERSQISDSSPTSLTSDRLPTVEVPGAMCVATCGAVDRTRKKAGMGIVVRDNSRKLTATKAIPLTFSGDRILTEALAIRIGLLFAMEQ